MAKIPAGEGLGDVVVRPPPGVIAPAQAFSTGFGQSMVEAGYRMRQEELRQEHEAKVTRDAADRAKASVALQGAQDDLLLLSDEVSEGVRTGQIDKTKANDEFRARAGERVSAALETIPEAHRQLAQADLNGRATRAGRTVAHAVTQRDQQDVRSGIDATLENAQRLYGKDPAAADKMVTGTLEALGPFSGLDPAQLQKIGQGWKENTRYTAGASLVQAARGSNAMLDQAQKTLDGPQFADMDPQKKLELTTRIEGFKVSNIQKAEAEARRVQAAQEHRLKVAEAEFNAVNHIITTGKVLSPEAVTQASQKMAGTPYAAAFQASIQQGAQNAAFGSQSLAVQQQELIRARNQLNTSGTSQQAEKRMKELETIHQQAIKDYGEDPLLAAQERGVLQKIEPIDTSSVSGLVTTLGARIPQAAITQQQVGQPVSPLLKSEAEKVGKLLSVLPVEQRSTAIAQIAQAIGSEQASALGRQMAPKDKALGIALTLAGVKTTAGRYTSEIVLKGAQAIKDKAVKEDNQALTGTRSLVAAEIGNAYQNEEQRQALIDAGVYATYGLESEGESDFKKAVRLVTGGITERAGKKIPLPYGMDEKTFDQRIRGLSAADIKADNVVASGVKMPAAEFLKRLPDAALLHAGQGRYAVQSGSGVVLREDGKTPLIVEVK